MGPKLPVQNELAQIDHTIFEMLSNHQIPNQLQTKKYQNVLDYPLNIDCLIVLKFHHSQNIDCILHAFQN